MCLLLAGRIVKLACNCLTKFLRGDVGLGDLIMVEWHTTAIHIFLIEEKDTPRFGAAEEKPCYLRLCQAKSIV